MKLKLIRTVDGIAPRCQATHTLPDGRVLQCRSHARHASLHWASYRQHHREYSGWATATWEDKCRRGGR